MPAEKMAVAACREALFKRIGRRVAYYRKQNHWTQQELAQRIHRSVSTVSRIERGAYNHNIPLATLADITHALQIHLKDIFEE